MLTGEGEGHGWVRDATAILTSYGMTAGVTGIETYDLPAGDGAAVIVSGDVAELNRRR